MYHLYNDVRSAKEEKEKGLRTDEVQTVEPIIAAYPPKEMSPTKEGKKIESMM
jgi:hypothetical protein